MVNIAQPHPHNKEYADGKTLTHPAKPLMAGNPD